MCETDIGATIYTARVLDAWTAWVGNSLDPRRQDAAIDSFPIASNYGALVCASCASLTGLLWRELLKHKSTYVRGSSVN